MVHNSKKTVEDKYICVNCGTACDKVYKQFGGNAIRLTTCEVCKKPVDKYIEYDIVLVIIDVILQYIEAYRHLLLNMKFQVYHKLFTIFLLCDAYKKWIERRSQSTSTKIYDLEWKFYECLLQSFAEMFTFFIVIFLASSYRLSKQQLTTQFRKVLQSTCAGYFGNVFVVLSIIWRLHASLSYQIMLQIFLFVSHVQVQRVVAPGNLLLKNVFIVLLAKIAASVAGNLLKSHFFITDS